MEEGKREARLQKVQEFLVDAKQFVVQRAFDDAMVAIMKVYVIDPEQSEAKHLEDMIRKEQKELRKHEVEEAKKIPRQVILQTYKHALRQAWIDGKLTPDERAILESLRTSLQVTEDEHRSLEPEALLEAYTAAVREVWSDGSTTNEEMDHLEQLRKELNISAEQHLKIEQTVRREIGK